MRPYDSFGAGIYYNAISSDLKNSIKTLTGGVADVRDEKGMEVFCDFAFIPAMRLIISYQDIWDRLAARVTENEKATDVLTARMTVSW